MREPVTFMGGRRFEGSVSANGRVADLGDLKGLRFKTLSIEEIEEAIELLVEMREFMVERSS